ncbi:hypothetical protein EDD70_1072 [Hydrogenoanaerobacterium saccharovorans]|uniref:Uncharacterized protein n=1 Tax=Hydrogenoanaerobacterium saccharovorans TaxID=474960 RepID=A0A1H8A017_9FIRM|nr:hypothetical protein [Hydrogenoanaerobacterium saccharovorans]RPF48257.1 hypothetical protein EDD70_1072 [Hydrogenoanaerobacterium saccharovorans]SEM63921.1 hypothetical protein SAMN05216180_1019 [Hydrogenoanaerobacterium saccharovorans]
MTAVILLKELKKFIEEHTKDIILCVRVKKNSGESKERTAQVYTMQLPDKEAETQQIPYILLQFLTGKDEQNEGVSAESECKIRIVVATYSEDGGAGAMDVLNLLTRIRVALLKAGIVGEQFLLKKPLEYIVYPDSSAPYYLGEMLTVWGMPKIEREVELEWQ